MLDKKLLNSKTVVTYDPDTQKILELKHLVSHRKADGTLVYQFVDRKNSTSKRKASSQKEKEPKSETQNTE